MTSAPWLLPAMALFGPWVVRRRSRRHRCARRAKYSYGLALDVAVESNISAGGFTGISAPSPDDAWAVGDYLSPTGPRGFVEQWNGAKWNLVNPPRLPLWAMNYAFLHDSQTVAWADGYTNTPNVSLLSVAAN